MPDSTDWFIARFENYRTRLRLSKKKARDRLMICEPGEGLYKEFDRICDSAYRSNNQPGISFLEKSKRKDQMYKPAKPKPLQLKLF